SSDSYTRSLHDALPIFPIWQAIIGVLALLTIVHGGVRALRQSDLKLILAFSTVSQLGMLILLVGSPFQAGALAGMALLGAHALRSEEHTSELQSRENLV